MLLLVGECLGVKSETINHNGNSWVEETVVVLQGLDVHEARISRDYRGSKPDAGEFVAIEVEVQVFATRNGAGKRLQANARSDKAESALRPLVQRPAPAVKST